MRRPRDVVRELDTVMVTVRLYLVPIAATIEKYQKGLMPGDPERLFHGFSFSEDQYTKE